LQASDLPVNENDNGTENYQLAKTSSRDLGVSLTSTIKFDDHLSLKIIGSERYSAYSGGLTTMIRDRFLRISRNRICPPIYRRRRVEREYGRFDS
jgi:hypothetical protein